MTDITHQADNRHFLISVDGGGTKTEICIYDLLTEKSVSSFWGGANYKVLGIETVRSNLAEGLTGVCKDLGIVLDDIALCLLGVSGYDTEEDKDIYETMMVNFGFDTSRIVICNDSELIFRGLVDEPGLCIVAGTGSIVFGFSDDGRKIRAGGWGAPLSDQGSGYWIGAEIFRRYLDWFDGIEKWNEIFFEIEQLYGRQDPQNIAAKLACMDYSEVASFARIVMDTANRGNQLCCDIVSNAAEIISKLVISVYSRLSLKKIDQVSIVEVGSLFRDQYFEGKIQQNILSFISPIRVRFLKSASTPAESGIQYAKRLYHERFGKNGKKEQKIFG